MYWLLVLPEREPINGFIQVKSVKDDYYEIAGPVYESHKKI